MHFTMEEDVIPDRSPNCLVLRIDPAAGASAERVYAGLLGGHPAVFAHLRDDTLIVDVEEVSEDHARILAERIREEIEKEAATAS